MENSPRQQEGDPFIILLFKNAQFFNFKALFMSLRIGEAVPSILSCELSSSIYFIIIIIPLFTGEKGPSGFCLFSFFSFIFNVQCYLKIRHMIGC